MIALLLAVSTLIQADAPDDMQARLAFLAATQEQTQQQFARLSYDATIG